MNGAVHIVRRSLQVEQLEHRHLLAADFGLTGSAVLTTGTENDHPVTSVPDNRSAVSACGKTRPFDPTLVDAALGSSSWIAPRT